LILVIVIGVVLALLGVSVIAAEAHAGSGGVLGVPGALVMAGGIGAIIAGSGADTWLAVLIAVAVGALGTTLVVIGARKILVAARTAAPTGTQRLIGSAATVRNWHDDEGQVLIDGTIWHARVGLGWQRSPSPQPGESVIIEHLHGLTLSVRPRQPWELESS